MKVEKDTTVKSASRAFDVLEFVAKADTAPSFPVLVQKLAIPKSSLFILLTTLLDRGYLQFANPDRSRYQLGPRIAELAQVMERPNSAVEKARPVLRHLSNSLNETSGYYEKRGDEVVCLATEPGRQPLRYAMEVGQRVRLYANSCGKALLAAMPAAELKDYFNTLKPIPYTPRTMSSVEAIRRNLVSIRKSGISRSNEEYLPGIVALAVAVWDKDGPIGAINVAVPTVRFNRDLERAIQRELKSAAKKFEAT